MLGWVVGSHQSDRSGWTHATYRERHDTVHTILRVPRPPIITTAHENRVKSIRIHDTLYTARCLDTVIASDTLSVCYARDTFAISLHFAARQMPVAIPYVARDSIIAQVVSRPWYEDVLMVIVSFVAGMVLGKLP
jgi:hypothetical protein